MDVTPAVSLTTRVIWWVMVLLLLLLFTGSVKAAYVLEKSMSLENHGDYAVGYQYRSGLTKHMPQGWTGDFDAESGVSYRPVGTVNGKVATLLHCPWRGGTGVAFQEFSIQLPDRSVITLRGATAMSVGSVGKSDGARFRVFVNGRPAIDRHQLSADWSEFDVDLSKLSGKQVLLRFETDPGPNDRADFDFSLWGDRRIELDSQAAPEGHPAVHVPVIPDLDYSQLGSESLVDVVPLVVRKAAGRFANSLGGGGFKYRDSGGLFNLTVDDSIEPESPFPAIKLTQAGTTNVLSIPQPVVLRWSRPVVATTSSRKLKGNSVEFLRNYLDEHGDICIVSTTLRVINQSVVLEVISSKPWLSEVATSGWHPEVERILVPTPYYGGQIALLKRLGWFANQFFDWKASGASSLAGGVAGYASLTDGSRNMVRERIVYSFSNHLEEVFPHVPNAPSPYRNSVAGRVFLDSWGGSFSEVKSHLERLEPWGLSDCVLIVHDWQRSGYDNALPAHVPASAAKGGERVFREFVTAGKAAGCLVAAHQNYTDIYQNYEHFSFGDVALDSGGKPQKAWLNVGTGLQSFAIRPNTVLEHAAAQAPEISKRYGTNAAFLDVVSSMPPWFHVDMRASELGSGRFDQVFSVNTKLWQKLRTWHQGPVFGEGGQHWFWAGLLDGVPAQPGAGWELGEGDSAPLAVGFSLLKLLPLQVDHGMGYYHRWSSKVNGWERPPDTLLDRYRMQEVAFAHAAYLDRSTWHTGWDFWLEHNLVSPIVNRATQAKVSSISYWVNGDWVSMSAAAWAEDWSVVKVSYSNGLEVIANSGSLPLSIVGKIIYPNGWIVRGAGVVGWSIVQEKSRNDYMETESSVFANMTYKGEDNDGQVNFGNYVHPLTSFPKISTNGSAKVTRLGDFWFLRIMPSDFPVSLSLNMNFFGGPNQLECNPAPLKPSMNVAQMEEGFYLELVGGTICTWIAR